MSFGAIVAVAVADGVLYLVQRNAEDGTGGSGDGGARSRPRSTRMIPHRAARLRQHLNPASTTQS